MESIAQVEQALHTILEERANALAQETGCIQRQRKFTGASLAQTLIFSWQAHPAASLEQMASMAQTAAVSVSDSAVDKRFTPSCTEFLRRLLEEMSAVVVQAAEPVGVKLLGRFAAVILEDSAVISLPASLHALWPGCGNQNTSDAASLKLHVRWELQRGRLDGPALSAGRVSDHRSPWYEAAIEVGALSVQELGYFNLHRIAQRRQAGAYSLSRLQAGTVVLDRQGRPLNLLQIAPKQVGQRKDVPVLVGSQQRLRMRLLLLRVPKAVAEQRRERLLAEAKRRGQEVSAETLALADWTLLITDVPRRQLSLGEALVLLRERWQMELLYKLWKQDGQVDEWRTANPWRVLCEVYAKLIGLLLQHWLIVLFAWHDAQRSLVKLAHVVRDTGWSIMEALAGFRSLRSALLLIARRMRSGSRMNTRKQRPNSAQLLTDGIDWALSTPYVGAYGRTLALALAPCPPLAQHATMEPQIVHDTTQKEESMDEQVEVKPETQEEIQTFAARYPFPLDPFQIEAIIHLAEGRSVMVAAPTGTGKTLVAEYAIWCAQQHRQRVIYTTPLKALSNQKYRDMRTLYGPDAVGLVTGDIVEHSSASIVIMTTEVYRNMLLEEGGERFADGENLIPSSLADVGYIIFDELHYLSDVERGPVWEEAIICSPPNVQLVGLSATVSNAQDLADWISRVHRPIALVVHEERAVPLEHYYFLDNKLHLVQDADGKRIEQFPAVGGEARLAMLLSRNRTYTFDDDEWWDDEDEEEEEWVRERRTRRAARKAGAEHTNTARTSETPDAQKPRKPERPKERKTPAPGEVLTALRDANLLPCLYFLPGRKVVAEAAMSAGLHSFTTEEEQAQINAEVAVWLERLPKEDRGLQQVHMLTNLLPRGLAFHHAGLLPGLKVLVETLFARGYLRAVFATDTLSLGINMPARAVVVGSLSKFDGQEMRLLTPNEYRQLTGRAGRRGMDVRGAAVIPYSPWEPFEDSFKKITGELLPVTSSFVIRYNSVLNLWRPGDVKHLRRICASSLREYQRYVLWEQHELLRLEKLEQRAQKGKKAGKKKGVASAGAIQAIEKQRKHIGAYPLSRAGAAELDGTIFSLHALNYIGQNDELTLKGRLLRSIFHPAGVLIIELIMNGMLDELTAAELAEVCSWFTYDSDRRLNNRSVLNSRLLQVRRELWQVAQNVHAIEMHAHINPTPDIVPDFHSVAFSWARGMSLSGLLQRIDLAEGDLLMLLNQTIDLLQQVQSAVGQMVDDRAFWQQAPSLVAEPAERPSHKDKDTRRQAKQLEKSRQRLEHLRPLLAQASSSLIRGIIIQSRTMPSMVAIRVGNEELPLDAQEDAEPDDVREAP